MERSQLKKFSGSHHIRVIRPPTHPSVKRRSIPVVESPLPPPFHFDLAERRLIPEQDFHPLFVLAEP